MTIGGISFRAPSSADLDAMLAAACAASPTYPHVGATLATLAARPARPSIPMHVQSSVSWGAGRPTSRRHAQR